jgi:hypothetical protein
MPSGVSLGARDTSIGFHQRQPPPQIGGLEEHLSFVCDLHEMNFSLASEAGVTLTMEEDRRIPMEAVVEPLTVKQL